MMRDLDRNASHDPSLFGDRLFPMNEYRSPAKDELITAEHHNAVNFGLRYIHAPTNPTHIGHKLSWKAIDSRIGRIQYYPYVAFKFQDVPPLALARFEIDPAGSSVNFFGLDSRQQLTMDHVGIHTSDPENDFLAYGECAIEFATPPDFEPIMLNDEYLVKGGRWRLVIERERDELAIKGKCKVVVQTPELDWPVTFNPKLRFPLPVLGQPAEDVRKGVAAFAQKLIPASELIPTVRNLFE